MAMVGCLRSTLPLISKALTSDLISFRGSSLQRSLLCPTLTNPEDLCYDKFGISKEKKDSKNVKGNRDLLDELPEKRRIEDGGYLSDNGEEPSLYKKRKRTEKHAYDEWKSTVIESNNHISSKRTKQAQLNFPKLVPETEVEAM